MIFNEKHIVLLSSKNLVLMFRKVRNSSNFTITLQVSSEFLSDSQCYHSSICLRDWFQIALTMLLTAELRACTYLVLLNFVLHQLHYITLHRSYPELPIIYRCKTTQFTTFGQHVYGGLTRISTYEGEYCERVENIILYGLHSSDSKNFKGKWEKLCNSS